MNDEIASALLPYLGGTKEVNTYITALRIGGGTAGHIARINNESRSTITDLLERLVDRGIFSKQTHLKLGTFYIPISPEILSKKVEVSHQSFLSCIPRLQDLTKSSITKSNIQTTQGIEGFIVLYERLLDQTEGTIYSVIGKNDYDPGLLDHLYTNFVINRINKGIFAHVLAADTPQNREYASKDEDFLKKTYLIQDESFVFSENIDLFGNNNILFSKHHGQNVDCVWIQDNHIYETLRSIFLLGWMRCVQ